MKTLGRILIILLVAAIVAGGTYALLQPSAGQALAGQPTGSDSDNGNGPALSDLANGQGAPTGEMRGGDHEGRGGSWETLGQNLLIMAALIAAVQVLGSIERRLKLAGASLVRKGRLDP